MTLGERVKYVRKSNKLNQVDFAKKLGISQTHVSKIEKNIENPSETLIRFISYMFAVNITWLKTGDGEPDEYNGGLKEEFNNFRQHLEVMMNNMNEQQTLDFLDTFRAFINIYSLSFDEKMGFEDDITQSFGDLLNFVFILLLRKKTTSDTECKNQVALLKNALDKYVDTVLK